MIEGSTNPRPEEGLGKERDKRMDESAMEVLFNYIEFGAYLYAAR